MVTHMDITLQVLLEPLSAKSEIFAQSSQWSLWNVRYTNRGLIVLIKFDYSIYAIPGNKVKEIWLKAVREAKENNMNKMYTSVGS